MKPVIIIAIAFVLGTSVFLFSENIYAEQAPGLVTLVNHDPYYFGENNFGIDLLRYYDFPLTPYLTSGVTKDSSDQEIMDAYYDANTNVTSSIIAQTSDRAISFILHIESPEIFEKTVSFNFQLFNPETNPNEFTLQSIASKDKQEYYEFAARYINAGGRPDPFNLTIDVVTGDGTVLQKWNYYECKITYFETYLQDNLTFIMFLKTTQSEIRDYSEFNCSSRYMQADMDEIFNPYINYRGSAETKIYPTEKLATIPSRDDRAMSFLVSFVGPEIPTEITSQTFQQFGPLGETIPQYYTYVGELSLDPQFFLESLVSKDKQGYYELVSRYITAGKIPDPFDVTIDVVTGDGTPLLRWQYFDCSVTSFETYLQDSLVAIKFYPGSTPEIRDHTEFECVGFYLEADFEVLYSPYSNVPKESDPKPISSELGAVIPQDSDRAMSYVVHFSNGDFETTKTIRTFAKFEQTEITEFNLQSLPSQDKNEFYDVIISHSLNPGKKPEPFDVTVDLIAGDNTILQKWQYYQCGVTNYLTELNDNLLTSRFNGKFTSEIREKTSFDCQGQDLVADPLKPISIYTSAKVVSPTLNPSSEPGGIVPMDDNRAISYVVHLVGADIPQETFSSFAKFNAISTTIKTVDNSLKDKPVFSLTSLPSSDKENFYSLLAKYVDPGKTPEPFDVAVDIVLGDNTVLQTWHYFDCQIIHYEVFLEDIIIIVKYNTSNPTEIRDTTGFECDGFHFETPRLGAFSVYSKDSLNEKIKINNGTSGVIPSNDDRPMSYVVKFSGGEAIIPHTYLTFSKYKQTGTTEFWLESLPSHDKKSFYDFFIYRYINPGKIPELFDVSISLIKGDGTSLQSWQYHKCSVSDFVTYRNDDLLEMRFDFSSNYEIRDRSTFDCAGVYLDTEKTQFFSLYSNLDLKFKVREIIVSPHSQIRSGVPAHEVECKKEMELMIRPSRSLSYCVDEQSLETLQALGWEHISKKQDLTTVDESRDSAVIQGTIPAKNEHAISYVINLVGSEIPETIHQTKFSKFAPFTTNDIIIYGRELLGTPIATATIPGDTSTIFGVIPNYQIGEKPEFYLESLPAKDKTEFYKWISQYVNPGKRPDPIDVGVEILDGDGNLIQIWVYRDCVVMSYQIFLEENIMMIKYHGQWASEIKDRVMFTCNGLHINEL